MVQLGSHAWNVRSLVLLAALFHLVSSSIIATFTDDQCKNSFQSFTVENGYPNGTCARLADNGKYGSFQVVGLDPGCSATIYGADAEEFVPCSSTALQFAQIASCYNASWVYYSVDMCTPPNPTINPSRPTGASTQPNNSNQNSTGAIVGGVVGGVGGLALIGLAFFLVYRRRRNKRHALAQLPAVPSPPPEVAGNDIKELPQDAVKSEIYTSEAKPHEIGRNSLYIPPEQPPVELEGSAAVQDEKHGI